jgi:hypothetical protein
VRRHRYEQGDFFSFKLGNGSYGLGLVSGIVDDGVVAVHLLARQFGDPPTPLALALQKVSPGDVLWGTRVDDKALARIIGSVPELHVEEWELPAIEEAVARPEDVVERLTRLFAQPGATAHLFTRGKWYILAGLARTEVGVWMEIEPAERLPHSISDAELGAAVRAVLERPVIAIPHPTSWDDVPPPPSQVAAGVKTHGQFNRGAHLLNITRFEDRVQLTPSRKQSRRGFEFIPEEGMMVDFAGDDQFGAALREALSRSR